MSSLIIPPTLGASAFGRSFLWGVGMAAAQNEGAAMEDGRGASIWDAFAKKRGVIKDRATPAVTCDFYHRYRDDLLLAKSLGFSVFRFSIAWSRVIPEGTGRVNQAGVQFYQRVIDACLELGMIPCITVYHWDLPLELEKKGGWTSPLMNKWFNRYVELCAQWFGDRVKHWIVLNEPMGFTTLGYLMGKHAPGKTGLTSFFDAAHHAALAQADGSRILRSEVTEALIGSSVSMSWVYPASERESDQQAAARVDVLMNRLFLEPMMGKGYPEPNGFNLLEQFHTQSRSWKYTQRLTTDLDFVGVQYYFPVVIKHHSLIPYVQASLVKPKKNDPQTGLGWRIDADSFYRMLKRVWKYGAVKSIWVSENGASFPDQVKQGRIADPARIQYFQDHLHAMLQAKKDGVRIKAYLAWTLTDNFEWQEGFDARFGLVHTDFNTQLRTVKDSGYWWRQFLSQ